MNETIQIPLYYTDHIYETEEEYAEIKDHQIRFCGITSEKAPGGTYGISHPLDEENTQKLFDSLRPLYGEPPESIRRAFAGEGALRRVIAYCKEHGIHI